MRCKPWTLALAILLTCGWLPVRAATACIDADIGIDAAHRTVSLDLTLPQGTDAIALKPMDGYRRSQLWQSADGSTVITDDGLRLADPHQRRMRVQMDVRTNLERPDRTYPPFLRFADGTIAVESDAFAAAEGTTPLCLRFVPAPGERVIGYATASTRPLHAPAAPAPAAYVAFGTPRVERVHSLLLVSGRGTPDWIRDRLRHTIPGVAEFYRQRMWPMALPTIFFYSLPDAHGSGYHGDRLPGSLTLGLIGAAWKTPDASAAHQITEFVAHELFHVWNAAAGMQPVDAESNLASEGGAELAKMLASAHVEGDPDQAWLAEASTSLDDCLLSLPAQGSLAAGHLDHGQLPYTCGVPLMLVLAALNHPQDPATGFFRMWKALVERKSAAIDRDYRWTELAPPAANAGIMATLDRAVHGDAAYASAIAMALGHSGFVLQAPSSLSAKLRQRMNMQLMASLMAHDCGGRVSFWNEPSGFLLDKPLPSCRTLGAGKLVIALLGQSFADDQPQQLAAAIRARCRAGEQITAAYADGSPAAELGCPAIPPQLPKLLQIVGYGAH
ncbi:MAG: hypothetical protein ABI389_00690 [Rhodanobacter sp.]